MSILALSTVVVAACAGAGGAVLAALGIGAGWTTSAALWPVAAVCAVAGAIGHHAIRAIGETIDSRSRTLRTKIEHLQRDIGDIHGLVRLQPFTQKLPLAIGGGWALTGDAAALLVRETLLRGPRLIVELGSGVSTLLLGQVLKQRGGGRLVSIDHDPQWAQRTRRQVEYLGLEDVVTVVDAPLRALTLDGESHDWYDIPSSVIETLGKDVDLLVVDGPPQDPRRSVAARYPALPILGTHLSNDAWIFVDDAKRPSEAGMVERWTRSGSGWQVRRIDTVDGVCLLTRDRPATALA